MADGTALWMGLPTNKSLPEPRRMDAGLRKRVLLRLATAAVGVVLTLVFVAVAIGHWLEPSEPFFPRETALLGETTQKTAPEPRDAPTEEVVSGPLLGAPAPTGSQEDWRPVPLTILNPAAMAPESRIAVPAEEAVALKAPARRRPFSKPVLTVPTAPSRWAPVQPQVAALAVHPVEPVTPIGHLPKQPALSNDDLRGYTASLNEINKRLQPEVQKGFTLGKAGAIYAARGQFIGVLRKIALAKDAELGTTHCTTALADGLRALDEADDFVPRGDALEAELDTLAIADSHSTPVVRDAEYEVVTSHEAIALYSRYAAEKIGEAVAGEQAGSMACYGLGKSYARLEVQGDDATAGRKSAVLHRAALVAHESNYMAANELGVWLARVGRYEQAGRVLRQATAHGAPISTVYENLAKVEQKLGQKQMALAARQQSQQMAQAEIANGALSQRHGIEWVDPGAFRQPGITPVAAAPTGPFMPPQHVASHPYPQQVPQRVAQAAPPSGWQKIKQATGWSAASQPPASSEGWRPYPNAPRLQSSPSRVVR